MSYCQGKSQAKVSFKSGSFSDIVSSKNPPITVTCSGVDYVDFPQDMRSPINKTFDSIVTGVDNIGGSWNPGGITPTVISCPTTTKNPVNGVYPEANGQPIKIQGNKIVGDFDSIYTDNSGTCIYRVYLGNVNFTISDTSGIIYQKVFPSCPAFKVACDDECPSGHCKCLTTKYPGYCCISCKEIAQQINNLASRI